MAIEICHWGTITNTTARIFVKSDNDTGQLSATGTFGTVNGTVIATATDDGTGTIDLTGLTTDTLYGTVTVSDDDDTFELTLRTVGSNTTGLVGSCQSNAFREQILTKAIAAFPNVNYFIAAGDNPYNDLVGTYLGLTTVGTGDSLADAKDQQSSYDQHHRMFRKPEWITAGKSLSIVKMADDHEYINNFANDLTYMTTQYAFIDTQQKLDDIVAVQEQSYFSYSKGNNSKTLALNYYSYKAGDTYIIVWDCEVFKGAPGPVSTNPTANGVMLGDTQVQWIKDEIAVAEADSDVSFIIHMSSKATGQGNGDGWWNYRDVATRDELGDIYTYIGASSTKTNTMFTGDHHTPYVQYIAAEELVAINGCPMSQNTQEPPTPGANNPGIVYQLYTDDNGTRKGSDSIGVWETTSDRINLYIYNALEGIIFKGYQLKGSNELHIVNLENQLAQYIGVARTDPEYLALATGETTTQNNLNAITARASGAALVPAGAIFDTVYFKQDTNGVRAVKIGIYPCDSSGNPNLSAPLATFDKATVSTGGVLMTEETIDASSVTNPIKQYLTIAIIANGSSISLGDLRQISGGGGVDNDAVRDDGAEGASTIPTSWATNSTIINRDYALGASYNVPVAKPGIRSTINSLISSTIKNTIR